MSDAASTDRLIDSLAADLRPTAALAAPWKRMVVWALAVVWVGLLLSFFADLPGLRVRLMATPDLLYSLVGAVLTAVLAGVAALQTAIPGRSAWWALPLPALVLWVGASTAGCLRMTVPPATLAEPAMHPVVCLQVLVLISAPLILLLAWQVKRGCPLRPGLSAALCGLASAGAAAALLTLIHPFDATVADLGVHGLAVVLVIAVTGVAGRPALSRATSRARQSAGWL